MEQNDGSLRRARGPTGQVMILGRWLHGEELIRWWGAVAGFQEAVYQATMRGRLARSTTTGDADEVPQIDEIVAALTATKGL